MRRRVKFNKEMYVAALDKINVPCSSSAEEGMQDSVRFRCSEQD